MLNKEDVEGKIIKAAKRVKAENPMAASITNFVTIDFVANAQLAVGGSAAMVYQPDEAEACAQGGAMYINLGTLMPVYDATVPACMDALTEAGQEWVLDPVAAGLGSMRTRLIKEAKMYKPSIIRGNASEIITVAQMWGLDFPEEEQGAVRGVDSTQTVADARNAAVALANYTGGAVAVSGATDLVTDGETVALSTGGSKFLTMITGSGCSLGGVAAVYACVTDPFTAALTATNVYNLAGTRAEEESHAPASFKTHFLDELYLATPEEIATHQPFTLQEA